MALVPAIITNCLVSSTDQFRRMIEYDVKRSLLEKLCLQLKYIPNIFQVKVASESQMASRSCLFWGRQSMTLR